MNYSIRKGLLQAIDTKNLWIVGLAGKYMLIFLGVILYTLIIARASDAKAAKKYEAWQERYVNDFLAQRDAEAAGMPVDPYEATLQAESEDLARVLYGVKGNSTDGAGDTVSTNFLWVCVFDFQSGFNSGLNEEYIVCEIFCKGGRK